MGVVSFPSVASGLSTEQLADLVARMIKEVEWLANGNMDSANIRNIAGFNVDQTVLKHSSGIVGISGASPNDPTAIRFWSGNADPTVAPFRVTQAGVMTAVGGLFQSSTAYPRVELNSASALLAAYTTATNYIQIVADNGGQPALFFTNGTVVNGIMSPLSGASNALSILTTNGKGNINIDSGQDLNLSAAAGKKIKLSSWDNTLNNLTTRTLQQDLDAKANAFSGVSGTVYVSSTSGGPVTTPITFSNGIRTS